MDPLTHTLQKWTAKYGANEWHWTTNMAEPLVTELLTQNLVCKGLLVWTSGFSLKHTRISARQWTTGMCCVWMHTLCYFTMLHWTGALLCGLCCVREKVGGKARYHGIGHIPWLLILTDSFCPDPSITVTTLGQKWTLWFSMFLLFTPLIFLHLVW